MLLIAALPYKTIVIGILKSFVCFSTRYLMLAFHNSCNVGVITTPLRRTSPAPFIRPMPRLKSLVTPKSNIIPMSSALSKPNRVWMWSLGLPAISPKRWLTLKSIPPLLSISTLCPLSMRPVLKVYFTYSFSGFCSLASSPKISSCANSISVDKEQISVNIFFMCIYWLANKRCFWSNKKAIPYGIAHFNMFVKFIIV